MSKKKGTGFHYKKDYRRNAKQVLLAAVIGTALIGTSFSPVYASQETEASSEAVHMIPDIITVDALVSLAEISLPSCSCGKLKWADEDQIPSESGESFEVILVPNEDADLSDFPGWDEEEGVLRGYTEIVLVYRDDEVCEKDEIEETKKADETEVPEEIEEEIETVESIESIELVEPREELVMEEISDASAEITEKVEETEAEEAEKKPGLKETSEQKEETPNQEAEEEKKELQEKTEEEPESGNIFDEDAEPDPVPDVDVEAEMSELEKAEQGRVNHSSSGITISGPNLPWYVQFRVYDADGYSFSIEDDADIFRSYEFVLWDLMNDCEYEIPDGDYVSVVVPVMAGYAYTVEHILDSGAVETIVPTVVDSTVIFSTHSLSPFGIAGSVNIIGGEVGEENYVSVTPTPKPAATKRPTPTSAPSGSQNQSVPTIIPQGGGNNEGNGNTQISVEGGTLTEPDSSIQEPSETVTKPTEKPQKTDVVQTGDETQVLPYAGMLAAAAVLMTGIFTIRKKTSK